MKRTYTKLTTDLIHYKNLIDKISDAEFDKTPAEGEWSYAELYAHITSSAYMSLKAVEKCIQKEATHTSQSKNFAAIWILNTGVIPKGRKVPQSIAKTIQKLSKEDAKTMLDKTLRKVDEIYPLLKTAPKDWQFMHPRLGMLNAIDWFRFIKVHTHHHIQQLDKIKILLKNS